MRIASRADLTQGLEATQPTAGKDAPPGEGDERGEGDKRGEGDERARPTWRPGAVVAGRYRLERLLGEGGMGVIWAASHTLTGKPFALKFVKGGAVRGVVGMRLLREAKLASSVRHPNVVEVHDVEIEGGAPVMVMELLSGESLASRLRREPRLPLGEVASIFLPVISAVGTAHALGIVHRDLKPENIFLVDGSSERVKVLDFGIAKLTATSGQDAQTTGLTESGTRLGTPCYMSPEQTFGDRQIDHRTDNWSLGLILYECLSGVLPTRADNAGQVFKIIVTGAIPPLEKVAPDVPRELARVVGRLLSTDRQARLSDLSEVARALAPFAQGAAPSFGAPEPPALGISEPPRALGGEAADGDVVDPLAATERLGAAARRDELRSTERRLGLRAAAWKISLAMALAAVIAGALALRGGPRPVGATTVPGPRSISTALALYSAALKAAGDANEGKAVDGLRQAISVDDSFAEAHLRLAIYAPEPAEARDHYRRAEELSAELDPRDRALLAAMEPALGRDPADSARCTERLTALTARHPYDRDAELLALLARCALRSDVHTSVAAARRVIAIDPEYAQGWATLAQSLWQLGSFNDSAAALDRCLAISPTAASCYEIRSEHHSALGRCADVEEDLWLTRPTTSGRGRLIFRRLAWSSYAQGRSLDAVREAMRQSRVSLPHKERRFTALLDESNLNAIQGNFSQAEGQLRQARMYISADSRGHADVVRALIDVCLETDRRREAADIAKTCLDNYSACAGGSPDLLRVMLHAGLIARAEFQEKVAELLSPSSVQGAADPARSAVVQAYARWIEHPEEAAEAVPVLPMTALMSNQVGQEVQADVGAVFYLAGMPLHAIPTLRKAVTTCDMLGWPVRYVRSFWFLGQALEQMGEISGACEAYASVIDRWGNASPRSVTAEQARARMKAIACRPVE
ncbi:protein kinase domain-containing protein [Sorangium sp. So ce145]|uniref:protein kinase domain-containing protein n=1 Tax=Sorangium sp. So ce145 TaxID=3133285 RepID=UPI003F5F8348